MCNQPYLMLQVTPVPEESVTVEQYLQAECERHEKHIAVSYLFLCLVCLCTRSRHILALLIE